MKLISLASVNLIFERKENKSIIYLNKKYSYLEFYFYFEYIVKIFIFAPCKIII